VPEPGPVEVQLGEDLWIDVTKAGRHVRHLSHNGAFHMGQTTQTRCHTDWSTSNRISSLASGFSRRRTTRWSSLRH